MRHASATHDLRHRREGRSRDGGRPSPGAAQGPPPPRRAALPRAARWTTVGAGLAPPRATSLAVMLAALVLGALAGAAESFGLHVVALLERLAVLACTVVGVVGATGAILAGIRGDTPRALAFSALFTVAMLLLTGLALRAVDDEGADRRHVAAPARVRASAGSEGIAVLLCIAAAIAGLAGAIVGAVYDHPLRALGFAGLLLVAVGLLVLLALRGSGRDDRR